MRDKEMHMDGYEKESLLTKMHSNPEVRSRLYKWKDFIKVARVINPVLCEGAFERRPCERKLRYIGYKNFDNPLLAVELKEPYIYGNMYHSIDFNGGTYTIRETGLTTGCAYFEVVD